MKRSHFRGVFRAIALGTLFVLSLSANSFARDDVKTLRSQAQALMDAQKYTEALPIYEKLAKLEPKDPEIMRNLGFALIAQAANTDDSEARRQLRIRARDSLILARDYGDKSLVVGGMIGGLPADGRDPAGFSDNAEANKAMQKAEGYFASGKLDEAFKEYQNALKLDPHCYHAALFSGDVMKEFIKYDEAEKWYQKAISIDPLVETAYRYSATPLMKQGKYDQARDRYIEAYITAPYDKMAVSGIVGWAQATKTNVGHPRLDIPETTVGADGKANTNITVGSSPDDGSIAWMSYVTTRELWKKEKFAKQFPKQAYGTPLPKKPTLYVALSQWPRALNRKS